MAAASGSKAAKKTPVKPAPSFLTTGEARAADFAREVGMRSDLVQTVVEAYRNYSVPSARLSSADSEDRMYDRSAGVLDLAGVEKVLFKCGESVPALNFLYLAEASGELDSAVGDDFSDARITLGSFVRVLHAQ